MYPPSSMMTPDPDPDCACEELAGTPRVRIVTTDERTFATTAGTERFFSVGTRLPLEVEVAQAESSMKNVIRLATHRRR
jgi:hypothetical protein